MPVVAVRDQKTVVTVTYDPETRPLLKLNEVVLDSTNFPWKVLYQIEVGYEETALRGNDVTCILEPLRPLRTHHEVRSLRDIDSALTDAYRDTIYNYQILIESRDLAVAEVAIWGEDYDTLKTGSTFFPDYYRKDPDLPKAHILIRDKTGVNWGPLPCNPLDEPLSWPLPGRIGQATIIPEPSTNEERVAVSDAAGVMRVYLDSVEQAIGFASILDDNGWTEALKKFFPGKVFRLSTEVLWPKACTPPDGDLKR
jgi:hypothetical protein